MITLIWAVAVVTAGAALAYARAEYRARRDRHE